MAEDTVALAILGCGPAGLAAGATLARAGAELIAIDAGKALGERRRDDPDAIAAGVGGAGLTSDGKFSFFPAATRLWSLEERPQLAAAYKAVSAWLRGRGLAPPPFPEEQARRREGPWKPYPSIYMAPEDRADLIADLFAPIAERAWLQTRLTDLRRDGDAWLLELEGPEGPRRLRARSVILAGGRFLPLALKKFSAGLATSFRRVEWGLRLQGAADHPFFARMVRSGRSIDPKLLLRSTDGAIEWRSFCCCRQGEVAAARFGDGLVYSGRSDLPPTGLSNVGWNTRFLDPAKAPDPEALPAPYRMPLNALLEAGVLEGLYGDAAGAMRAGLIRLSREVPELWQRGGAAIEAIGPSLEGVGAYPKIDGRLRLKDAPGLFIAGDACGVFRGLVAALVSGAYAARLALSELEARPAAEAGAGIRNTP